nr:AtpZ/AtpI family protein [uncultured Holophaga sp.]
MWGDLLSLGMVFPLCIVLGYFAGRWAGGKLGYPTAGMWVGLVWGIAAAFWELYKVTKKLDRMDAVQGKSDEKPRDPHDSDPR